MRQATTSAHRPWHDSGNSAGNMTTCVRPGNTVHVIINTPCVTCAITNDVLYSGKQCETKIRSFVVLRNVLEDLEDTYMIIIV